MDTPSQLRPLVLALALAGAAACTPSAGDGTAQSASPPTPTPTADEVPMSDAPNDSTRPAAPEPPVVTPASVKLGARTKVPRHELYGVGLVRPATEADVGALGLPGGGDVPALVVLATEHPSVTPPELQVRDRGGHAALVLTWLEYDPMSGPLPEVAEITYAWTVSGALPRWLVLRKTSTADGLLADLAAEAGSTGTRGRPFVMTSATGPAVSLEPAYLVRGTEGFFAQYGRPRPHDLSETGVALATVRPTASERWSKAMEAIPLAGGGVRMRLEVPIDPGLPVWGPRMANDELSAFSLPLPPGTFEWLLELQ